MPMEKEERSLTGSFVRGVLRPRRTHLRRGIPPPPPCLSMFAVYVLRSATTGKRYVGSTGNLSSRLQQHNQGNVRATKGGRPWELLYYERFETNTQARQRELSLKAGKGRAEPDRIFRERGSAP